VFDSKNENNQANFIVRLKMKSFESALKVVTRKISNAKILPAPRHKNMTKKFGHENNYYHFKKDDKPAGSKSQEMVDSIYDKLLQGTKLDALKKRACRNLDSKLFQLLVKNTPNFNAFQQEAERIKSIIKEEEMNIQVIEDIQEVQSMILPNSKHIKKMVHSPDSPSSVDSVIIRNTKSPKQYQSENFSDVLDRNDKDNDKKSNDGEEISKPSNLSGEKSKKTKRNVGPRELVNMYGSNNLSAVHKTLDEAFQMGRTRRRPQQQRDDSYCSAKSEV